MLVFLQNLDRNLFLKNANFFAVNGKKNIFAEKFGGFLYKIHVSFFYKIWIVTFLKNANFFAVNGRKSLKLVIITSDTWSRIYEPVSAMM
jgi:hypothetical protein